MECNDSMNLCNLISKYRHASVTFKATVWYTVCNVLQKISAFLVIPFLTRILDTNDYGTYIVFLSWLDVFEIFSTMRMYSNGYIAGAIKDDSDQERYTCSIQFLSIIITSFTLLIFCAFSEQISSLLQLQSKYLFFMFISYYATSSIGIWSARQRVNNRYKIMTVVTLCYGILVPVSSIIAAIVLPNKLNAVICSRITVQLLIAFPFLLKNLFGKSKKIVWNYCREALKYNIPLIPYYLSMVLLNNSDRIMIQRIVGESEAAIYGVAYSLAMAIFVFSGALNLALQPWMFRQLKANNKNNNTKTFNVALAFITVLNLMLLITAPELILITASKKYYSAIWTMPPIIFSLLIMFVYQQFLNVHFFFGKNKVIFVASVIAAGLNIVLNAIFIKQFGYLAAGYTTLISYSLIAILYYITMKKTCAANNVEYKSYFDMKFILEDCFSFAILTIIITLLYPYPIIRYGLIGIGIVICFAKRKKLIDLFKNINLM